MEVHKLKLREDYFDAVSNGKKCWELRFDDCGFCVGDKLVMSPVDKTGCASKTSDGVLDAGIIVATICLIVDYQAGLKPGWKILSLTDIKVHGTRNRRNVHFLDWTENLWDGRSDWFEFQEGQ